MTNNIKTKKLECRAGALTRLCSEVVCVLTHIQIIFNLLI